MMKHYLITALVAFAIMNLSSCSNIQAEVNSESSWTNLLKDNSLELWQTMPDKNGKVREIGQRWKLEQGVLSLDYKREGRGGQLITKKSYFNFELKFEFNIQVNCNSGVKYRTNGNLGLEYQIIDDDNYRDNKNPKHRTAGLYNLVAVPADRHLNPAGEWNSARIVANGNTIEHWLNGVKVMSVEYGSDDWKERLAISKYKEYPDFATTAGPILLQDHSDTIIEFKNILIKEL